MMRHWCCGASPTKTVQEANLLPPPTRTLTPFGLLKKHSSLQSGASLDKATPEGSSGQGVLQAVTATLRILSNLEPASPLEQLQDAAKILVDCLDVGVVSVYLLLDNEEKRWPLCLATAGDAAGTATASSLTKWQNMPGFTSFDLLQSEQDGIVRFVGQGCHSPEAELPVDWQLLHDDAGYNAFASSPIIRCGKMHGVISIAAARTEEWDEAGALYSLSAVSSFLSPLLVSPQLLNLSGTLTSTLGSRSIEAMVDALSMSLQSHFKTVLHFKLHARVALLAESDSAMIFENKRELFPVSATASKSLVNASDGIRRSRSGYDLPSSNEIQAKLQAIRKSTAVTSLEDFRSLATNLNDEHRTMLVKQASCHPKSFDGLASPVLGSPKQSSKLAEVLGRQRVGNPVTSQKSDDLLASWSSVPDAADPAGIEDLLLHMVHTAEDIFPGASQQAAHSIPNLTGTLLASVLAQEGHDKGTWIADLNTYMQQPGKPARDISLSADSPPLASLVLACMPEATHLDDSMLAKEAPQLAVYLTSPSTLSALQLQTVLRELQCVLRVLSQPLTAHLSSSLRLSWALLKSSLLEDQQPAHPPKSRFAASKGVAHQLLSRPPSARVASGKPMSELQAMTNHSKDTTHTGPASCSRLQTVYSSSPVQTHVAPLVAGLQDKLHHLLVEGATNHCFNRPEDLKYVRATKLVARGGFGGVYQGLWQGLDVAVKVVRHRPESIDSAREAIELAVLSTISHPNILQMQNYWTDVLVVDTPLKPEEQRPNGLLRLQSSAYEARRAAGSEQLQMSRSSSTGDLTTAERCMVMVTELCDHGALDKAIQKGYFFLPSSSPRVPHLNTVAVLVTLMEIAMALRHMHSLQLVHCDLKPGNVLLKSSASDVRKFTTKLCDFGLVKIQKQATDLVESARRSTFTGTVTHSPPEVLRGDPHPAPAQDVYAFGILMYELSTTKGAYPGLTDRQVAEGVVWHNLRPEFPRGLHPQYKDLAARCWSADASLRPTMDEVVSVVGAMLMDVRDRA